VKPGLRIRIILVIIALAAFSLFITWRAGTLEKALEQPTLVNIQAPDFWASASDGHTVSLADIRGKKKVVVVFWASWCGPCLLEINALNRFYRDYHTTSSAFEILAISVDLDTAKTTNFATAQNLSFPVLLDPSERVARDYDVVEFPTMFTIDKSGEIIDAHLGYDDYKSMESRLVSELGIDTKQRMVGGTDGNASH
jgi:peroxiredoxin